MFMNGSAELGDNLSFFLEIVQNKILVNPQGGIYNQSQMSALYRFSVWALSNVSVI